MRIPRIPRLKAILGLMLAVMVLISAAYLFNRVKQPAAAKVPSGSVPTQAALAPEAKLVPPPMKLEDVLANKQVGTFAGDRYDQKAVEEKLQQMPKGLSNEQAYAYVLNLVGESYVEYRDTYASLQDPNYRQKMLTVDPNAPAVEAGAKLKVEVVLDCSGSMADPVTGGVKMDLAKQAIQGFVAKLPAGTQVGLRVFGHKGSGSEKDKAYSASQTELVYPFSVYDEKGFTSSLQTFAPTGWTAIAGALTEAGKDLSQKDDGVNKVIYLVTDGIETCGGDPVATAKTLHESDIKAAVNIIGFDVDDAAQKQLKEASTAGGGSYVTVKNQQELQKAFQVEMEALSKQNDEWAKNADKQVMGSFKSDSDLVSKTFVTMGNTYANELTRLKDATHYLYNQHQIDNPVLKSISDWEDSRWKNLVNFNNEKSQIIKEMINESLGSSGEIAGQHSQNMNEIGGKK